MKKYNRPEIEALALEVIDVIETSGAVASAEVMKNDSTFANTQATVKVINQNIAAMDNQWQW